LIDDRLNLFFDGLMSAFLGERSEEFQSYFVFPVVIYSVAGVTVVREPEDLLRITGLYREALKETAMVATNYEISSHGPPRNNRLRATLSFSDFLPDGATYSGSVVQYYLVDGPEGYKIEMMEYLEVPLGISDVERIVH